MNRNKKIIVALLSIFALNFSASTALSAQVISRTTTTNTIQRQNSVSSTTTSVDTKTSITSTTTVSSSAQVKTNYGIINVNKKQFLKTNLLNFVNTYNHRNFYGLKSGKLIVKKVGKNYNVSNVVPQTYQRVTSVKGFYNKEKDFIIDIKIDPVNFNLYTHLNKKVKKNLHGSFKLNKTFKLLSLNQKIYGNVKFISYKNSYKLVGQKVNKYFKIKSIKYTRAKNKDNIINIFLVDTRIGKYDHKWTACQSRKDGTFVEVFRSKQVLCAYKNGKFAHGANVVTGDHSKHRDTPAGTWTIWAKQMNKHLIGSTVGRGPEYNYDIPVKYWMPIDHTGVGLHSIDPDEVTGYQGRVYWAKDAYLIGRGSHGCVNLHTPDAKWIFQNIPVGSKVYVR